MVGSVGNVLDLFTGTGNMSIALRAVGFNVVSLDVVQYYGSPQLTHKIDILEFDYQAYPSDYFNFLYIALPCDCFSKASGGYHFYKNRIPVTCAANTAIQIMGKIHEIIRYFDKAVFVIENPSGGLANNFYFKNHCFFSKCNVYTTSLGSFGFPTQKKTDLFTNSDTLLLLPQSYRVNGRYSKKSLDNMTKKQRSAYPLAFCFFIADYFISIININYNYHE